MKKYLGRSLQDALASLPPGANNPRVLITTAPARNGETRREGALRLVCCRGDTLIAARFSDQPPRRKEEP